MVCHHQHGVSSLVWCVIISMACGTSRRDGRIWLFIKINYWTAHQYKKNEEDNGKGKKSTDKCAIVWYMLMSGVWMDSRHHSRKNEIGGETMKTLKSAIHYSQTWRIGDKIIFSPNKIFLAKTRRTCCCTLFVVCRQFSHGGRFFFSTKKYFVFVDETATPTQILRTAYGEKPVRET